MDTKPCTCLGGPCDGECGYDAAARDAHEHGGDGEALITVDPAVVVSGSDVTIGFTVNDELVAAAIRDRR